MSFQTRGAIFCLILKFMVPGSAQALEIPARVSGPDVVTGKPLDTDLSVASKGTVIAFLSAKCPCSASHETVLGELASEYSGKGFRFVGVHSNADESADFAKAHFERSKLVFPVIEDSGAKIADQLGALKTPHVFVINSRREVVYQGGVDDSHVATEAKSHYLRDALGALSQGRTPSPTRVRALGCIIKRP
jgi:peroxiredoxin